MKHKKLQFLVPQYKENEKIISFLLDSIECQKNIDMQDIGVIICSDGGEYILKQEFLDKYSFDIDYIICKHRGVSATRNSAFLLSDADYVMFCDADDGFCNIFGVRIILENIKISENTNKPFDILSCKFYSETDKPVWGLEIRDHNNIYIHSRVYRKEFLVKNTIFFDERIWANEDCFFNITTNLCSKNTKFLNVPIYCWIENKTSVTHDSKYLLKTLHQLVHSCDSIVEVMLLLKKEDKKVAETVFDLFCKAYLDFNNDYWYKPENVEYKNITLKTLQWFMLRRSKLCKCLTNEEKRVFLQNARNNSVHYKTLEIMTFDDFLKMIVDYEEK